MSMQPGDEFAEPMKIGITCYPTYGGSGVLATELGIALAKRGHEIHFITYDQPIRLQGWQDNVFYHAVDMLPYPLFKFPPYTLAAASKLIEVVQTHRLDVLHAHYAIPHTICALLAREVIGGSLRIVTTLHGTDITLVGNDPSFAPMTKYGIERSDAVTAVSSYLRHETRRYFGVDRDIEVIYNFVDTEKFRPAGDGNCPCEKSHFAPNGERVVMHISNFRPVKRVNDVVRAFQVIHEKMPAKLVMVGDGPDYAEARALCVSLGFGDDALFLGRQDCIETLLPCADLFLLPSEHESFGLAALEALSCGVPVVASGGSGVEEVLAGRPAGTVHKVGDHEAMGRSGAEILSSPEKLAAMSRVAREVAEGFHTDKVIPEYERFYERVIHGAVQPVAGG